MQHPSASEQWFDEAYYERYYFNPRTRVVDEGHSRRLADFVCSYLAYLRVPVVRVLDMGCGLGLWREQLQRHYPKMHYQGVELSPYLCERYGWEQASVLDYRSADSFDLVICQGVLPYLSTRDVVRALDNLGRLCQGALYLEAVTREDFAAGVIDEELTDMRQQRHPANLYRQALAGHFRQAGGGLWLSHRCDVPLFALEECGVSDKVV
ncbi:MAG: class I SAM-dependent methyltransferase [Comamonas sp.]|nr:class I SAM-dependent methyltransferase [Comamonas sp.]